MKEQQEGVFAGGRAVGRQHLQVYGVETWQVDVGGSLAPTSSCAEVLLERQAVVGGFLDPIISWASLFRGGGVPAVCFQRIQRLLLWEG